MTTTNQTPQNIIDIPTIDIDRLERNQEKGMSEGFECCPCCGRAIKKPQYFFNSIYGGCAYPANDKNEYNDAWVMGVGTECRKRFPEGYIFTK